MNDKFINVTDSSFQEEVLDFKGYVLVNFWAAWCGPCNLYKVTLNSLFNELNKKMKFVKINVNESQIIKFKYNVKSIPTLILFKNGEYLSNKIGVFSKKNLIDFLKENNFY